MTASPEPAPPEPAPADIGEMRLRQPPPSGARLNRKALLICGVGAAAIVAVLLAVAMRRAPADAALAKAPPATAATPVEAVSRLPKDYEALGIPVLGPPLPGDLGGPIVANTKAMAAMGPSDPQPIAAAPRSFEGPVGTPQRAGLFFARSQGAPETAAPETEATSAGHRLIAGTLIPAALITSVRADLEGEVIAQVTSPVLDSKLGRFVLIPQGARLIGRQEGSARFGQSRIRVAWTRLQLPDGRSLSLAGSAAADGAGQSGLQDRVDRRWASLIGMAAISTVLAVGAEAAADDDGAGRAVRRAVGETGNLAGQALVGRQADVGPVLSVRAGHPVMAILTEDVFLEPLEDLG